MGAKEFEIEDLLQDSSFCDYCLGKDEQSVRYWEDWMAAQPANQKTGLQAKELYLILNGSNTSAQYQRDLKQFRAKMEEHILPFQLTAIPSPGPSRFRKIWRYAGAAAAAIILVIGIRVLINQYRPGTQPVAYVQSTRAGERKSFQLPDGSKVMLNAGSYLSVAKDFNYRTREIQLEGEAFFDVSHNALKPFIIHTSSIDVKVLGTVFNVRAYPSDKVTETSLLRGSVLVILRGSGNKEILLHPNEKIILSNELREEIDHSTPVKQRVHQPELKKYKIAGLTYNSKDSSSTEFSWTENRLIFSNDTFDEIASRLERWYNVSIHFDDDAPKQYRFTGTFDKKTIEQVLDALQLSRRFEYEIKEGKQIIIKK